MMGRLFLKISVLVLVLGALLIGGSAGWIYSEFTRPGPLAQETVVVVPTGGGVKSIAKSLAEKNVIRSARIFEFGARALDDAGSLRKLF